MKVKIRLDTMREIQQFVNICSKHTDADIHITDGADLRVNAKSVLGAMYSMEFSDIWCESDKDISGDLLDFII